MKVAIASDHRGFAAKERILELVAELGHETMDMGTKSNKSCDYPDSALPAAQAVSTGDADRAILICGSGIGMSIVANKVNGVRGALCHDELTAKLSRKHNNANALCLAADAVGEEVIRRIVTSWLNAKFDDAGRHTRRVKKIAKIEGLCDK